MSCVTYYPKQILPLLFYSPDGQSGAICLEDWEKAELAVRPLVETPMIFFFFNVV